MTRCPHCRAYAAESWEHGINCPAQTGITAEIGESIVVPYDPRRAIEKLRALGAEPCALSPLTSPEDAVYTAAGLLVDSMRELGARAGSMYLAALGDMYGTAQRYDETDEEFKARLLAMWPTP